jgi:hypothetical protein
MSLTSSPAEPLFNTNLIDGGKLPRVRRPFELATGEWETKPGRRCPRSIGLIRRQRLARRAAPPYFYVTRMGEAGEDVVWRGGGSEMSLRQRAGCGLCAPAKKPLRPEAPNASKDPSQRTGVDSSMVEQHPFKLLVLGSNPSQPTMRFPVWGGAHFWRQALGVRPVCLRNQRAK